MSLHVLVVAQTPPPIHGQALMTTYLLSGNYRSLKLSHIRMAFSSDIKQVGRASIGKLAHTVTLITRIFLAWVRLKPDVLYYPPASPNLAPFLRDCILLICCRWMFSKTVFHFHANGISEFRKRLPSFLQWAYFLAYGKPELSICLSQLARIDAEDIHSKAITIVANGIPDIASSLPPKPPDKPQNILYLGTVSLEKGVGALLDCIAMLAMRGHVFSCTIAGGFSSDSVESQLKKKSRDLNLERIITWTGPVSGSSKWECYQMADIFCFPTFYETEGFPVVLLEAMMFRLPCVSTSWRAIPEIIDEGVTGFLTPIHDVKTTTDRLSLLLSDTNLRQKMGAAAREKYSKHYRVEIFQSSMETALLTHCSCHDVAD